MIVLWLLVAHLTGDYLLQTRWQANGKFGWTDAAIRLRARHVFVYCLCFLPVTLIYSGGTGWWFSFLVILWPLHFLTDAQRFTRTPGEWLAWEVWTWLPLPMNTGRALAITESAREPELGFPNLTPNPWPPIGLAIDQTLHLIQIAILAQIFLR